MMSRHITREALLRKLTHLQSLRPEGFRTPRTRPGGSLTALERLSLECGFVSMEALQPEPSRRAKRRRRMREFTRAVQKEERELNFGRPARKFIPIDQARRAELYKTIVDRAA